MHENIKTTLHIKMLVKYHKNSIAYQILVKHKTYIACKNVHCRSLGGIGSEHVAINIGCMLCAVPKLLGAAEWKLRVAFEAPPPQTEHAAHAARRMHLLPDGESTGPFAAHTTFQFYHESAQFDRVFGHTKRVTQPGSHVYTLDRYRFFLHEEQRPHAT